MVIVRNATYVDISSDRQATLNRRRWTAMILVMISTKLHLHLDHQSSQTELALSQEPNDINIDVIGSQIWVTLAGAELLRFLL